MRPSLGPRLAVEPHGPQGGRQVNRELFPLPSVHVESLEAGKLSRKVRQRIGRRRHLQEEVQSTVNVLNMMHGGTGGPMSPKGDISSAQQKVLEFIEQSVAALGSPPQLSGPEALEELRVSVGYGETPASCPLGSFDPASVSLPSGEIRPVALEKLWGEGGQQVVKEFSSQMLGPDEVHAKLRASGDVRIYNDPKLNDPKEYGAFISRLHSLGLAEFCLEPQEEEVGLFFVKKKQNRLRLIMDCRRANLHFAEPSTVELATGDALGKLEVGRDDTLYLASADLANAFYTLELPAEWRRFFGFRRVRAVHLGVVEVNGQAVAPDTWVYPRTLVVPMGWAWALWWCQSVNERICERSGLAACHRVRDGFPIPGGSFWHLQYVDNLHVLGTDKTEVEKKFWDAVRGLREAGLTVHEIEFSESTVTMLGWQIEEKGVLRPTYKRIWRIRIAIRELLSRGRMTGQQLERLIGHMTFVSLWRREALAVLGEVYTFIRRHYLECVPIWKTVRKELMKFDGLCPLIFNNMRSGWSNTVYAVDASEWGLGVVRSEVEPGCSKQWGQHLERWRFKDANAKDPRRYVLVEDERNFVVDEDSPPPNDVERHYKTVGFEAVDRHWQVVGRFKWLRADSMPVLEARASLYAVKHFLRNSTNFGQRLLVLTDSMTAAVAYDKGRAQSHKLRRVLEQFSALALSTGLVVRTRWIPSERNPADSVSRGGTAPSNPQRRFDDPPTVGSGSELVQQPSEKEGRGDNFPQNQQRCSPTQQAREAPLREVPLTWQVEQLTEQRSVKKQRRSQLRKAAQSRKVGGVLRKNSVGHLTQKKYQRHWEMLQKWSHNAIAVDTSLEVLDSMLANYLEHCYLEGEDLSFANYALASVVYHLPRAKGAALPLVQQSMRGWQRLCPPRARLPIPYEVVCLLSMQAYKEHKLEICVVLQLMFLLYLRPGEAFTMRVQDIVFPVKRAGKAYKHFSILLHPSEEGIPSKTKQWDEMLSIDLKHMKFLGPALEQILDLKNRAGADKAFTISLEDVNQFMESNWEPLGLKPLGKPHAYRLRHGGASYEAALKLRTLASIQSRGRWQTLKSVKNYEKGSRLAQLFGSLSKATRDKAVRAKKDVVQVLSGKL